VLFLCGKRKGKHDMAKAENLESEKLEILKEIREGQKEALELQKQQFEMVQTQYGRAEKIQDKAESLQNNANRAFKLILPIIALLLIVIFYGIWKSYR
jgi:hypothetical protein